MRGRVGVVSNTSWSLYNFRRNLIRSLLAANREVIAFAPPDSYSDKVASLGCKYVPVGMNNRGRNPFQDFHLFLRLVSHFRREKLACALTFTPKPNIYGCWAARVLEIPAIANVAGLGSVFTSPSATQRLVKQMYRVALTWPVRTFFQNSDDMALFTSLNVVPRARAELLPGSGVDVEHFAPGTAPDGGGTSFLFSARLLREKGVQEYVAAARALKRERPEVEFRILGFTDVQNPSAISAATVKGWAEEGVIRYLGDTADVRPFIADADCVVLPSYYREGTPRTLLEAASMGKPVITTDMPGCRHVVEDGVTGFLVQPRDVRDLVAKMSAIATMPRHARQQMGNKGREKMIREFDERRILKRYLDEVQTILFARGG
jgi:glycosyltransferase involved in cell wall biosynthesis